MGEIVNDNFFQAQEKLLDFFKKLLSEDSSRDPKITYLLLMYKLLNALKVKSMDLENW